MVGNANGILDSVVLIATILAWRAAVAMRSRWCALRRVLKSTPSGE